MKRMQWLRRKGPTRLPSMFAGTALMVGPVLAAAITMGAEPVRPLTFDGRTKLNPIFLKSGQQLVYTQEYKFNQLALMKLDVGELSDAPAGNGTRAAMPELLHPAATTSEFAASWSADEQILAYVRNDGNLHVRLVIEDGRTGTKSEFDPGGGFAGIQYVSVAPDGQRVFFAFPERGGAQQIFAVRPDGKGKEAIISSDSFETCPRVSPDGRRLAFASSREGNFDIYVANIDGSAVLKLTEHPGLDLHPAWSPDGKWLAYTSLRDGNFDVYMLPVDGGPERRLTDSPERDDYPVWHPQGRNLVTVSERNGRQDLYLWKVDAR